MSIWAGEPGVKPKKKPLKEYYLNRGPYGTYKRNADNARQTDKRSKQNIFRKEWYRDEKIKR